MKIFRNMKVKRYQKFYDDYEYTFECSNCQREVVVPSYLMAEKCECGVDWKVEVVYLATGKKEK